MSQDIFCASCHRVPSQCVCRNTKPLTYEELGRLAEQASKETFGKPRLKPEGGISISPMLERFAELIQERHGIKC